MSVLIIGIVIGLVLGYIAGIRRAEYGIARAQVKRTWAGRASWRQ